MFTLNPLLMTDFYKSIHHLTYVPGMEYLTTYWTMRMSRIQNTNKGVVFGIQAMIKDKLIDDFNLWFFNRPWNEIEHEYIRIMKNTMCNEASDITEFKRLHDLGFLPIEIKAIDEGERVTIGHKEKDGTNVMGTPVFSIENTIPGFGWLVNYLETYISVNIWHPMTSATIAYNYRMLANKYYEKTVVGGNPNMAFGDFSMRGMTSQEAAFRSSAAHLLSFTGSATIGAIPWLEKYYNCDCTKEVVGKGVPSLEHSVVSSYGVDNEFECYRHVIQDVFPSGIISVVSDTYDYWKVVTEFLPKLKPIIMNRDGKVVIRGDSGDPIDIICGELKPDDYMVIEGLTEDKIKDYFAHEATSTYHWDGTSESYYNVRIGDYLYDVTCYHEWINPDYDDDGCGGGYYCSTVESVHFDKRKISVEEKGTVELLWDIFGGFVNEKGYKVLDSHIAAIYGDSITIERANEIYRRLEAKGFAVSCVTLGIGSYTYQYVTRDSLGQANKATHAIVNGEERVIYKDPKTDKSSGNNFKKSQRGKCYVYKDGEDIIFKDGLTSEEINAEEYSDNLLKTVFKNGKIVKETSLAEIRNKLHNGNF